MLGKVKKGKKGSRRVIRGERRGGRVKWERDS